MSGNINSKLEVNDDVAAATYGGLVITWTSNEPTAGTTQTIADGTIPTVAELGQAVKNLNTQLTALGVDVGLIRTQVNT
jgi:hypothetical protein